MAIRPPNQTVGRQGGSGNRRGARKRRGPLTSYAPTKPALTGAHMLRPLPGAPPVINRPAAPGAAALIPPKPMPAPVQPQSTAMRANAESGLTTANTNYLDSVWRAAMSLGDPSVFSALQADPRFAGYKFTQDPNSLFSSLGRDETQGLQGVDNTFNEGNAFFSGYRLQDRTKLSDDISRQRLAGGTDYTNSLTDFAKALAGAQDDYRQAIGDADQFDIDTALANDPEDRTPGPTPKKPAAKKKSTTSKPPKKRAGRKKTQTYKPVGKKPNQKSKLRK